MSGVVVGAGGVEPSPPPPSPASISLLAASLALASASSLAFCCSGVKLLGSMGHSIVSPVFSSKQGQGTSSSFSSKQSLAASAGGFDGKKMYSSSMNESQ